MMINLITDIMTYEIADSQNIKSFLDLKGNIIYFDNNRRLNAFSLMNNI